MIKIKELHKCYAETVALAGVDFNVATGTTFGLLGPNGAGKTTIINILCGLLKSDSGTVSLAGRTDPTVPDVRSILGVVPQTIALYEQLSGEQNLAFFGSMYALAGRHLRKRICDCLEIAGLTERRKDHVAGFSHFSPVKWGIYSMEGAIWRGFSWVEMLVPCAVLVSIGAVFFVLGVFLLKRRET